MKNMALKKRLPLCFIILAVALVIMSTVGSVGIMAVSRGIKDYQATTQKSIVYLGDVEANFENAQKEMYRALATKDLRMVQNAVSNARQATDQIKKDLELLLKTYSGDMQQITELTTMINEIDKHFWNLMNKVQAAGEQDMELWTLLDQELAPRLVKLGELIAKMVQETDARGVEKMETINRTILMIKILLPLIGSVMLLVAFVLAVRLTRAIVQPLEQMERAAAMMEQGNLDIEIPYESKNECGNLAHSMRQMAATLKLYIRSVDQRMDDFSKGNLKAESNVEYRGDFISIGDSIERAASAVSDTMLRIQQASDEVANGSQQVSSGAHAASQGATEQASSVEQLAATINEISAQVKDNAENATSAQQQVEQVSDEMAQSNEKMQDMISAMKEITESSQEISKIIKTIEDIAFQTNILALNAAVEAARAGAAGKGFAVVAGEVRNLASKSSEASKSTAELIERSMRAVENGMMIADDTASALSNTVQGALNVAQTIAKISEASNEQASAITQVTIGIDQISAVVQTSSATAEQSAAASEQLSGQAETLKKLVGAFRLKGEEMAAAEARPYTDYMTNAGNDPMAAYDKY